MEFEDSKEFLIFLGRCIQRFDLDIKDNVSDIVDDIFRYVNNRLEYPKCGTELDVRFCDCGTYYVGNGRCECGNWKSHLWSKYCKNILFQRC